MLSIIEIREKYKKYIKLMYNISKASFVSLFMFLLIVYLSTLSPFNSSINKAFTELSLSILIFEIFFITLVFYYKIPRDKFTNTLTELEKLYPEFPFIIMGIGFSLLLITFLVILNIPPKTPIPSTVILTGLMAFGLFLIPIGFILLIVSLSATKYLEGQVSFTLEKANEKLGEILRQVEDKNQSDTKNLNNFNRYIYLTYRNIERKFGTLDLEYTFLNSLPDYIKVAEKEQLKSLKNHIKIMKDSVKENDDINFKMFNNELIQLSNEIRIFFKDNNLRIGKRRSVLNFFRDMDNIKNMIIILSYIPILFFFLLILYSWYSGEIHLKSLIELVLNKLLT